MAKSLDELVTYLEGLQARPPLDELAAELQELDVDCADLADFIRFSNRTYMRNLVRGGTWYNLLVLCWKNGQRSPIHDSDMHQVSNLQPGTADLVTLHVYSPPLLRMGTYSLTDLSRGEELMFVEFCEAAGI
jgi:cysteine dioxygenase